MSSHQCHPATPRESPETPGGAARAPQPASRVPELLAPAGDWECAKAAVENGADAIYFGLERFNARLRAHNFTEADLPRLMEFLHRRGVKGYVTFNTLVFENEMAEAEQYARAIIAAGVDAAIVQDVGICRLIRRLSPDFPIHVSTQMTITSAGGVEFARDLGCNLVVLARECSLKEIEKIIAPPLRLEPAPAASLPLEVFIHGALCVAYSGQCLTSEALGGRSANRGECAQACRMPYELLSDGKLVPLGDRKYLLSPQDLAGLEVLPELVQLGVASLKIEGRLKAPEYVANITRIYRQALDAAVGRREPRDGAPAGRPIGARPQALGPQPAPRTSQYEMEMAFSRGLYTGWFRGTNNQQLVHGRFGKKRGVYLGQVAEVRRNGVSLHLEGPLKPGDGIVFDAGHPEGNEEGGRVYDIRKAKPQGRAEPWVELGFGRDDIDFDRVHVGDKLWKTSDPELERHLRQSYEGDTPKFQRPIAVEVHGLAGQPLTLIARDELGHVVRFDSVMPLVRAESQPLTTERLRAQLGRLGGTPFRLGEMKNLLGGEVLLPVSELNRLRREMARELETRRAQPLRWTLKCRVESTEWRVRNEEGRTGSMDASVAAARLEGPELVVLLRNLAQLDAALQAGIRTLYCDFEDPKKYRDAVARFRAVHGAKGEAGAGTARPQAELNQRQTGGRAVPTPARATENRGEGGEGAPERLSEEATADGAERLRPAIFAAPPRIFKMGEDWTLRQVRSCEADGYLVRNYDHLNFFANERRIGDYSLNIANHLAADYFKNKFGLERVTASYDLNFTQLEALLQAAPPEWFEVTIHQHIPMFHMEHCIFCAFLSSGTDYTNCGRPCDRHDLKLRDRVGAEHPVKADVGCRNTVFNALAQTGADYVARLVALGVRRFRLEFLNESPAQVAQTIAQYRQLLRGEITGPQLWRELNLLNQLGVTRGQMGK